MKSNDHFKWIYMAWLVNLVSFCGSMYFSNVMMLTPCTLCWYQRICIFPMTILLAVGFLLKEKNVVWYALPLIAIGWVISMYHNLLYYKIIPKAIVACTSGVSCTDKQIEYLGIVTIPLMALTSLTITFILLMIFLKQSKKA